MRELFLHYLESERNYSDKTLVSYRNDLIQFEEYLKINCPEVEYQEVDADIVRGWVMHLMDNGYTETSVNRKLSSLRSFYKFLLKKKYVKSDPLRLVSGPKKKKPLPVFVREADMDKLLDEVDLGDDFQGVRDKLILQMFYETGVRLSELVSLDDCDVDLSTQLIKVTGKRNKQRYIPFGLSLKTAVGRYVGLRNDTCTRVGDAFFVRKDGSRLSPIMVYEVVKRNLSKVVTLKKRSPHVLRHSFATAMLNNDAGLESVKELLGHESLTTTEVYTHTTFEELKKVYKQAHPRA